MRCDKMISWVGTAMGVKNTLIGCDAVMLCPVCQKPEVMSIYLQINTSNDATHGHLGVVAAGQLGGLAVCDGAVLAQHGRAGAGGGPHPAGRAHTRQHFRYSYSYSFVKHETQIQY